VICPCRKLFDGAIGKITTVRLVASSRGAASGFMVMEKAVGGREGEGGDRYPCRRRVATLRLCVDGIELDHSGYYYKRFIRATIHLFHALVL